MARVVETNLGTLVTGGDMTMRIVNAEVLEQLAAMSTWTEKTWAQDAYRAVLELADIGELSMDDAVKGKINVQIMPSTETGMVTLVAEVLPEPAVRRTLSRRTIRIDKNNRLLHSARYTHAKEVPSITQYVASQMKIGFDAAAEIVAQGASARANEIVQQAARLYNIKMTSTGIMRAPAGGVEFGGTYFAGGRFFGGSR